MVAIGIAKRDGKGTLIRVYSTSNCAKIIELRRGVDPAEVFSLAISPSSNLLAVTSDKSTLHIFDLPPLNGSLPKPTTPDEGQQNKWGILGKIPLLPRVFSDVYSFASAHFELGDDYGPASLPPLGSSIPRPSKGVIGWMDDKTLVLVSAGKEGRWEKFVILEGDDRKRYCVREGWKRYLGG